MHISLARFLPVLLPAALCAVRLTAQAPAPAANKVDQAKLDAAKLTENLPTFLLVVPGGKTVLGTSFDKLVEAVAQSVNPMRPEIAQKTAGDKFARGMKNTISGLGRRTESVETYLLGRFPVTNKQYANFIRRMQELKQDVKPPYHWWRYGRKDDYDKRLADIAKEFPKDKNGPLYYWERHGKDLPWDLKDEHGKSIEDQPVVFVSYKDAQRFAGWIGMRLPTEAERTRAVRGDADFIWPWGGSKDLGDAYTEKALEQLKLKSMRDQRIKKIGEVPLAIGPYGHTDLTGQVWEFTAEIGYRPLSGPTTFADEWKKLQKDRNCAQLVPSQPNWNDAKIIAKGGSYLSATDPIQLMVDARMPLEPIDAVESLGIRVAKSLKPGYDLLFSLLRGPYNRSLFQSDQQIDLGAQIGVERYVLDADGFPSEYHAVSFAPSSFLSKEKNASLEKALEASMVTPVVVGTFATTEKLVRPELAPDVYTVLFRRHGMPKELTDALRAGHKEVQDALKAKERGEDPAEKSDKPKKGADWRGVIARYGITEKDLEDKDALDKIDFVRFAEFTIPVDKSCYLLSNNEGKVVALVPSPNQELNAGAVFVPTLEFEAGADKTKTTSVAKFRVPVVVQADNSKRVAELKFELELEFAKPTVTDKWRLPAAAKAMNGNAASNNSTPPPAAGPGKGK